MRFAALVESRGETIPLDEAAALIAQCADPNVEPDAVIAQLDGLAETAPGTRSTRCCRTCSGGAAWVPITTTTTTRAPR